MEKSVLAGVNSRALGAILIIATASGCSEKSAGEFWRWAGSALGIGAKDTASNPVPTNDPELASLQKNKSNAEFLQEAFRVVWLEEPGDKSDFMTWLDALNQGASFEGVYNGFTRSSHYRELEVKNRGATLRALKAFSEELTVLTLELQKPTRYEASAASPLPAPVSPTFEVDNNDTTVNMDPEDASFGRGADGKLDPHKLRDEYAKIFVGSSVYTLKRILGDEAMKVIARKSEYREKLAEWYSKWVVRLCTERTVDFGLALRNKADESLHYRWAVQASNDRILWETLNRLHRVINAANQNQK